MHTILGAGGAIGVELAKSLKDFTSDIRLVSRNPKKINETDNLLPANLLTKEGISKAVAGSEVCYLTIGLDYKTKLWQETWPTLMENVVAACIEQKSKLVFFDNVYAIGGDNVKHITETSPISPCSKKGEVRTKVDRIVLDNIEKGKLEAIIARAPDFFGPIKDKSMLMNLVYDNLAKGKKAQWLCNADAVHTTGFTPDLGRGTAMLGTTPDAFNQIWNLPVDPARITTREFVKLFVAEMGGSDKVSVLPSWAVKMLGIFVPILGEIYEMRYQFDRDYYFDSGKFCKRFNYTPTSNAEAVKLTVAALKAGG
ncbi:MAG: NAD-dependent epimerase/dehydratase family protein [Bacteroidetes bacterium]|nr:NAD-dependent epimerase/dehydratase family protein [Bacteroidota bacterium]